MDMCSVSIGDGERVLDLLRGEPSAGLRLRLGDRRLGDPEGDRRGGERPRERDRERDGEREPIFPTSVESCRRADARWASFFRFFGQLGTQSAEWRRRER